MTKSDESDKPRASRDQIRDHLKRVREEVGAWPEWKKDLLGWRYTKKKAHETSTGEQRNEGD